MSRGVRKHFFYYMRAMKDYPDRAYVDYGMADVTGTPKPDGFAYAAMAWLLEDMRWETEWQRTARASRLVPFHWRTSRLGVGAPPAGLLLRAHLFEGRGRAIAVLWAEPGARVRLSLPPGPWEVRGIMGNALPSPIPGPSPKPGGRESKGDLLPSPIPGPSPKPGGRESVFVTEEPCYLILPGGTADGLAVRLQRAGLKCLAPPRQQGAARAPRPRRGRTSQPR